MAGPTCSRRRYSPVVTTGAAAALAAVVVCSSASTGAAFLVAPPAIPTRHTLAAANANPHVIRASPPSPPPRACSISSGRRRMALRSITTSSSSEGDASRDQEEEEEVLMEMASDAAAAGGGIAGGAGSSSSGRGGSLAATFSIAKRKLWTKADYLHLHAITGALFMGLGSVYVVAFLADGMANGAGWALREAGTVGWVPLAILLTGVGNCVTCLPMSKFTRDGVYDTKSAGFKGLGIGMTMLGCWLAWFFSGHYPTWLGAVDSPLAAVFLAVIVHGIVNSEVALTKELEEKQLLTAAGDDIWTDGTITETRTEIVLNHRVASYPNLLHLPVLYNVIAGGQAWAHKVTEVFPLEPTLLFHASFGIAVANSIVFLGATLKDRKLMTLKQWLILQVVVLTPFVTTVVDSLSLGRQVSINPFETYAGLMP